MTINPTLPKDWPSDDHQIEQHLRNLEKASEMPTLKQRLHREVNFLDFSFVAFKLIGMNSWCIQFIANMLDLFPPHFRCVFKSNIFCHDFIGQKDGNMKIAVSRTFESTHSFANLAEDFSEEGGSPFQNQLLHCHDHHHVPHNQVVNYNFTFLLKLKTKNLFMRYDLQSFHKPTVF